MPAPKTPPPPATLDDFWKRFGKRDFKRSEGADGVMDTDVEQAFRDAQRVFNARLFSAADGFDAFLLLAAHYVRVNVEAAGGLSLTGENEGLGVENEAEQLLAGAGAAGVNKSFVAPPDGIKNTPLLLSLWGTTYGQKFAVMVYPKMRGAVRTIPGPNQVGAVGGPPVPFADQ